MTFAFLRTIPPDNGYGPLIKNFYMPDYHEAYPTNSLPYHLPDNGYNIRNDNPNKVKVIMTS